MGKVPTVPARWICAIALSQFAAMPASAMISDAVYDAGSVGHDFAVTDTDLAEPRDSSVIQPGGSGVGARLQQTVPEAQAEIARQEPGTPASPADIAALAQPAESAVTARPQAPSRPSTSGTLQDNPASLHESTEGVSDLAGPGTTDESGNGLTTKRPRQDDEAGDPRSRRQKLDEQPSPVDVHESAGVVDPLAQRTRQSMLVDEGSLGSPSPEVAGSTAVSYAPASSHEPGMDLPSEADIDALLNAIDHNTSVQESRRRPGPADLYLLEETLDEGDRPASDGNSHAGIGASMPAREGTTGNHRLVEMEACNAILHDLRQSVSAFDVSSNCPTGQESRSLVSSSGLSPPGDPSANTGEKTVRPDRELYVKPPPKDEIAYIRDHFVHEIDGNGIVSTDKQSYLMSDGSVYAPKFSNMFFPDSWIMRTNAKYPIKSSAIGLVKNDVVRSVEKIPYNASTVVSEQYRRVATAQDFYGLLPDTIIRHNVTNLEMFALADNLHGAELLAGFLRSPNGKHT
ncbi:hypothetical protein [Paraburkholderia heleia]|uniref:hypothetical protein n=1 Tax=Paraburkholderia heleia TaxID=634127 RepID=UPI002AB6AD41|nr:hypothetical protein [Paraburkholderia heleia]